jgi:alanyl-tRNA synthetase
VLSLGDFSKELCGGTHARRTGDIGLFNITAEYGVASGVRRIEMVTGRYALAYVQEQQLLLNTIASQLKTTPTSLEDKLTQLIHDTKQQEKELTQLKQKIATQSGNALLSEVKKTGDVNLLVKQLENVDGNALRTMLDQLKSSMENAVIVLIGISDQKMNVVVGVSKNVLGKVPTAAMLVKHLCGKGGGRDDMAQGGGSVPDDLEKKVADITNMIEETKLS